MAWTCIPQDSCIGSLVSRVEVFGDDVEPLKGGARGRSIGSVP